VNVRIAPERCQGHGQCNLVCPEIFDFDEQGFGRVRTQRVPEPLRADVERAERTCPERAIEIHG
jgi:ferredoxin